MAAAARPGEYSAARSDVLTGLGKLEILCQRFTKLDQNLGHFSGRIDKVVGDMNRLARALPGQQEANKNAIQEYAEDLRDKTDNLIEYAESREGMELNDYRALNAYLEGRLSMGKSLRITIREAAQHIAKLPDSFGGTSGLRQDSAHPIVMAIPEEPLSGESSQQPAEN